jgi:hypothetical protein
VRGIDAYRDSWPPFFEWQRQGACFEVVELDVTAGADVAFAYALLRCGTTEDFAANPDNKLRLTVGLRKRDGRFPTAVCMSAAPTVEWTIHTRHLCLAHDGQQHGQTSTRSGLHRTVRLRDRLFERSMCGHRHQP